LLVRDCGCTMTANVQGLAKSWYLKFVQPEPAAKFIMTRPEKS